MTYLLAALLLAAQAAPSRISEVTVTDNRGVQFSVPAGQDPVVALVAGDQRVLTLSIDGAGIPQVMDAQGFRLASLSVVNSRLEITLFDTSGHERARVSVEMPEKN